MRSFSNGCPQRYFGIPAYCLSCKKINVKTSSIEYLILKIIYYFFYVIAIIQCIMKTKIQIVPYLTSMVLIDPTLCPLDIKSMKY